MSALDNHNKKKCVAFVDEISDGGLLAEEALEKVTIISCRSSFHEESFTSPSEKFLAQQVENLKKNIESIESSVETQLLNIKAYNYEETDALEERIKMKIKKLKEEKKLKEDPGCCTSGCCIQ